MAVSLQKTTFNAEQFFQNSVSKFVQILDRIEHQTNPNEAPENDQLFNELRDAIHESRVECRRVGALLSEDPSQLKEIQERFRKEIAPWFDQSWFMSRAKEKPRGYPGDYEMLTAIYDENPKSGGIGGYLDRYFLQTDLARAVRSRLAAVKQFLIAEARQSNQPISVLNVASGPGREYTNGFQEIAHKVRLTCIDTDESALNFFAENISPEVSRSCSLKCVQYNALKTKSSTANIREFGDLDMIYSVGLCDYLPDNFLIKILEGWRNTVSDGGVVYVAFKDATQYHPSEYQWHVDWHFYERTESDCFELFEKAGYDTESMKMSRDETGIIMNFVSYAEQTSGQRIDGAQKLSGPHRRGVKNSEKAPVNPESDSQLDG